MSLCSQAFLIIALVISICPGDGATADAANINVDQIAEETHNKARAVTIVDGPKYVPQSSSPPPPPPPPPVIQPQPQSEQRPPSKPPIQPEKQNKQIKYTIGVPRIFYNPGPPRPYHSSKPIQLGPPTNVAYKYPKVVPLKQKNPHYPSIQSQNRPQLAYAASTGKPYVVTPKGPKFNLPVQTVNGIRSDFVRPPKLAQNQTTTTTTTTTPRPLRTKRIWPKHILDKKNPPNDTTTNSTLTKTDDIENSASASVLRLRIVNRTLTTTTSTEATTRVYRKVTRLPKHKSTTPKPLNLTIEPNDWVPIIPSHYPSVRRIAPKISKRSDAYQTNEIARRSDGFYNYRTSTLARPSVLYQNYQVANLPQQSNDYQIYQTANPVPAADSRHLVYLQTNGYPAMSKVQTQPVSGRKKMRFFRKRRQLNPYVYSGFSTKRPGAYVVEDLQPEASHRRPRVVTKIKHHHHHHHHKYVKTVEKPVKVPVKVEVPKPYPVPVEKRIPVPYPVQKIVQVEKKVPYPVTVEKRIPYPVQVAVPHAVPVKVVEKEYVPKPYPIIHHVPVIKHVEVKVPQPYPVEKKVPYPVEVQVPVDRPVPVHVEKEVRVPVPVKVLVPQPYPVEKRVPYPVEVKVKEPYEVIRHVPIRVPVPQPFAVKVPQPYPVEKKVPYPVEVEKQVPVPFKVYIPQRVEVEKKVYVPKPYPVEKRVPVQVKVPYPVSVPVYITDAQYDQEGAVVHSGITVSDVAVTSNPFHTVTVHGNTGFQGFSSRSDSTTPASSGEQTTTEKSS